MRNCNSKSIGRCLTEYKHQQFADIATQSEAFIKVSQFDSTPTIETVKPEMYQNEMPKCSYGELVYAVSQNELVMIYAIIDSSD